MPIVKTKSQNRKKKSKKTTNPIAINKKILLIFMAVFAVIGGFLIYRSFAATYRITASQFGQTINDGGVNAIKLSTATPVTTQFTTNSLTNSLTVNTRADLCKGNPDAKLTPDLQIVIDGTTKSVVNVPNTTYTKYTLSVTVPAGTHTIAINLTNPYDKVKGNSPKTCNKAIYVEYIELTGPDAPKLAFTSITAGERNFCGILSDKTVACWGSNYWGQSGGKDAGDAEYQASQTSIDRCIATNGYGGGDSTICSFTTQPDDVVITKPTIIPNLTNVTKIAATQRETCAVSSAKVYCWGNFYPSLDTSPGSYIPTLKSGIDNVIDIGAQSYNSFCASSATSNTTPLSVYCWTGSNAPQLSTTVTSDNLSGYPSKRCSVSSSKAYCSGDNTFGQLGNGTTTSSSTPVEVLGITGSVTSVISNEKSTSCALADGAVYCWGHNWYGTVGVGTGGVFDPGCNGEYFYTENAPGTAPWYYPTAQKVADPV